jgi:hypothetical protein
MKQWFLNLMRRLDNWEASFGTNMDRFELMHVHQRYEELAEEMATLDLEHKGRLEAYDLEARLKRDNFIARLKIEAIDRERELATIEHRKHVLETLIGSEVM